jgi:hypothetical protein
MHHRWDRHARLSVAGALTVSPVYKRLGFYCSMRTANLPGDDLCAVVQQLRGHLKRPLLIMWDRFSGQKKAARFCTTSMANGCMARRSPPMPLLSLWSIMPGGTPSMAN